MNHALIHAGGDEIAEKVREQLLCLSDQVSGAVADAVALSMITGAAAAFRQLSGEAPHVQDRMLETAVNGPGRLQH